MCHDEIREKYSMLQSAPGPPSVLLGAACARARRKRLAGQVVLITGGSRGFGLALAREFATLQCRIALCARDHDELERAQQTLGARGL